MDLLKMFKQESAQMLVVACALLAWFWQKDAPDLVLIIVGSLAALFIVFEKVRATWGK